MRMNQVDLSIIIVSYNTKAITLACIESIPRTLKKVSYEIIVVDNASADGSVEAISKFKIPHPKFQLIKSKENVGFSRANNIGVKESSGRYVLFLNSDTVVYEETIDGMVKFMEAHKDAGAATCFVELPNRKLDDAAHRGFPTPWRALAHFSGLAKTFSHTKLFGGYNLGWEDFSRIHEIDALAGAFMLVRRIAGKEIGWWDEDFFWYGDDLDFCYRLKERGWKIYFVPQYKILHYKGVSGGLKKVSRHLSTADKETRRRAITARFAAMKIFYDKHYKDKYPWFVTALVRAGILAKQQIARYKHII